MKKYFYDSHMGGIYSSEKEYNVDELYCDECGDSDWYLGSAENEKEAYKMLKFNNEDCDYEYKYFRISAIINGEKRYYISNLDNNTKEQWFDGKTLNPDFYDSEEEAIEEYNKTANEETKKKVGNNYTIEEFVDKNENYTDKYLREVSKEAFDAEYDSGKNVDIEILNATTLGILSDAQMEKIGFKKEKNEWIYKEKVTKWENHQQEQTDYEIIYKVREIRDDLREGTAELHYQGKKVELDKENEAPYRLPYRIVYYGIDPTIQSMERKFFNEGLFRYI